MLRSGDSRRCAAGFQQAGYSEEVATGMALWQGHGPAAARSYAAAINVSRYGNLPRTCDWAAKNLGMGVPAGPRYAERKSFSLFPAFIEIDLQCDVL